MSRKRNRNVTGKWPSQPQLLKHVHDEENFFGSEIVSNFPSPEYDSFENFKANDFIRQVYFDGSSSSSLSGYEDFETEATHKVENELIQMNKVLQKEVPILDHYDKEEYEQWMHMFPDVSLWDRKNNGSTESVLLNDNNDRIKPRRNNFGFVSRNKNDLGESQNSLFFFKDENVHRNKRKTNHNINKATQQYDTSKQLFNKVRYRSDVEKVRALSRSEVLSSRWMKNGDNNQQHLPQICSASVLSARFPVKKTVVVEKKVESGHSLILPPIKNNRESRVFPNDILPVVNGIRSTKKRYSSTLNNNQYKSVRLRDARRKSDNSWL